MSDTRTRNCCPKCLVLLQAKGNAPIDQKPEVGAIHASVYLFNIAPIRPV